VVDGLSFSISLSLPLCTGEEDAQAERATIAWQIILAYALAMAAEPTHFSSRIDGLLLPLSL
jgi:hypothetical protein